MIGDDAPLTRFEFWLKGEKNATMPEGTIGKTKIVSINQSGFVELGNIAFTKAGEYRYTLTEVNGGQKHRTYDKSVYTLIVNVYETEYGLVAEQTLRKDGQPVGEVIFQNTYRTEEIVIPEPDPENPMPNPEEPTPDPEEPNPEDPTQDPEKPDSGEPAPEQPDEPNDGSDGTSGGADATGQSDTSPATQTGDQNPSLQYLMLWILSGSIMAGVILLRKRRMLENIFGKRKR